MIEKRTTSKYPPNCATVSHRVTHPPVSPSHVTRGKVSESSACHPFDSRQTKHRNTWKYSPQGLDIHTRGHIFKCMSLDISLQDPFASFSEAPEHSPCTSPSSLRLLAPMPPQVAHYPRFRYMGNKYRLLEWIHGVLQQLDFESATDAFCGSGTVSYLLKSMGKRVETNDSLFFSDHPESSPYPEQRNPLGGFGSFGIAVGQSGSSGGPVYSKNLLRYFLHGAGLSLSG